MYTFWMIWNIITKSKHCKLFFEFYSQNRPHSGSTNGGTKCQKIKYLDVDRLRYWDLSRILNISFKGKLSSCYVGEVRTKFISTSRGGFLLPKKLFTGDTLPSSYHSTPLYTPFNIPLNPITYPEWSCSGLPQYVLDGAPIALSLCKIYHC